MARAKKRATIKDVAAQAGVSYQTVSRVINNKPDVTDQTRQRVQEAITALNYRPNLAAKSLPSRRSYVIGLIVPYDAEYLFRDPHLLGQISGIDAEANSHDYNLLLSTAAGSASGLEAFERFIRNQVADGALVVETASSPEGCELLARHNYPHITLGHTSDSNSGYSVHYDDRAGARELTQRLLTNGHRRIGIINGPPIGAVYGLHQRLLGHQQALADANLTFDPDLMVYGDYSRPSGQAATNQLLTLPDPPTAIFAFNDRMAIGAIRAVQAAGLQVPDDVAVVGFDDIPGAADASPALTTVRQGSKEMGTIATQMLFKLIAGEKVEQKEVVLPAQVMIRQSA